MRSPSHNREHVLTVLVEDYFQVGAFNKLIQERNWSNFEARYKQNTLKALDLLDETGTTATFFVLGWIADNDPELIREIAGRGHEIASRGYYHRPLANLSREEFRQDLEKTSAAIQKAVPQKVVGYRSAEKLHYGKDDWVLNELAQMGYAYDASFMPVRNDDRHTRSAHETPQGDGSIWEFPYSTFDLGLGLLPISGGNYIRQIPFSLLKHTIRHWDEKVEAPFLFYFHVWELDPEQPRISAATYYNRVRHYRKLDKMEWVIRDTLKSYRFTDIAGFLGIKESLQLAGERVESHAPSPVAESKADSDVGAIPVSIVIPCYNEQETLPYLSNTLRSLQSALQEKEYKPKFVFVDDCSTDATLATLERLFGDNSSVEILRHEKNLGVAGAILTGIAASDTEIVCSMDCDCTYDPHELASMLPLLTPGVHMVTASPYHRDGMVRNVPGWRLFLSKGASFLYRRVLNSKLDTYTSCFRVYRRSAMTELDIRETGFLGVAEMLGKLDLSGGRITEYPAVLEVRLFGASKMKTARTIAGHLKLLTRLAKARFFGKNRLISTSLPRESQQNISNDR